MLLIISTICSDPAKNDITKFAVKEKWKKDITFIQGLSLNNEISCILREYMSQKNKMKYLILQLMFVLVMIIFLSLVTEKKKQTPKKRPPKNNKKTCWYLFYYEKAVPSSKEQKCMYNVIAWQSYLVSYLHFAW